LPDSHEESSNVTHQSMNESCSPLLSCGRDELCGCTKMVKLLFGGSTSTVMGIHPSIANYETKPKTELMKR
jgi:hypothetical protein